MLKGNLKAKICSLCFNIKCGIDFEVVEVIKEVLEIVLPKMNLEEGDKHLICTSCSVKLFAAFNFKSVCTDTEDTIFPYVNSQEMPLADLREVYLKEKGDIQSTDIFENQKICRLCFQSVGYGFVSLNEVNADIIDSYIPEVNFNATKDPVICKLCSDSLVTHGTFLSSCLAVQEENRKVCGDPAEDGECCIKIEETKIEDDCDSDPPPRLENVETIKNFKGRCDSKKKNEKHPSREVRTYTCSRCDFKTVHKCNMRRHCLTHVSLTPTYISSKSQCESKSSDTWSSPCPSKDQVLMYQCEKCPYRTHLKKAFISHWLTHEVPSEVKVYQCEICHYRVTREYHLLRHQLRHEGSAETIENLKGRLSSENMPVKKSKVTYSCNRCDFKTMYKFCLKRHCLNHISLTTTYISSKSQCESKSSDTSSPCPSKDQVLLYQCEKCPYRTHLKKAFKSHWLTHEVPSEVKVYQCEICHYRVTRECHLLRHQLRHEGSAETIENLKGRLSSENMPIKKSKVTYSCNRCDFKTMYKFCLKRHYWKHVPLSPTYISKSRDASSPCLLRDQAKMFQCEKCPYRTHVRQVFITHWSTHKVPSEVKVYQCEKCHYRAIQENHFRRHQLKHEDGRIVEKYTCDKCDFQTRYKFSLFKHQLRHKTKKWKDVKCYTGDDGQLTYKCNGCKYETKNRRQLLIHRCHQISPTKQQKFKCHTCAFETGNMDKLTKHQAKHNSKVKLYKCKLCPYQTILKCNFVRHQLYHKKKCEVKTYDCFKCSFRTKYKNNLKVHMLRHSTLE